jgi:hypothetical protein
MRNNIFPVTPCEILTTEKTQFKKAHTQKNEKQKNKTFPSFYAKFQGDLYCRARCGYLIKLGGFVIVESGDEAGDTEGTTPVRLRVPLLQRSYMPEEKSF